MSLQVKIIGNVATAPNDVPRVHVATYIDGSLAGTYDWTARLAWSIARASQAIQTPRTATGHRIGATYRDGYAGGSYRVIKAYGHGVLVERDNGRRIVHGTPLGPDDKEEPQACSKQRKGIR